MVGYSEIQRTSPFVAFLFTRLGALLESSVKPLGVLPPVGTYPPIGGFVFSSGGLGLVLGDLYPLLYKSQVWFKSVREVLRREVMGSDVGSGDLEIRPLLRHRPLPLFVCFTPLRRGVP